MYITRKDGLRLTTIGPPERWRISYAGKDEKFSFINPTTIQAEIRVADATGVITLFEPIKHTAKDATPYILDLPPTQPSPKPAVQAATGTSLAINQNDAPTLHFTGDKIGDIASVRVEGADPLRTEYDPEKKVLSVYLTQQLTKLPAKLALQFRESTGKLIATLILEVKSAPKPPTTGEKKPAEQ